MISDLPRKLQMLRHKYGYSQKQVAETLKVSPSVVSGYETGERTPSTEVLLDLSNLYRCSVDYLLGKEKKEPGIIIDTAGLSPRQIKAIQNLVASIVEKT